jgi:hypothetical protein
VSLLSQDSTSTGSSSPGPARTFLLTAVRLAGDQVPEMFGVGDRLLKWTGEVLVMELVDLPASVLLGSDEAEISEYAKLLGYRRLLHGGLGRQLLDRSRTLGE